MHKVAASDAPMSIPRISRRPSLLTPAAVITATDTMRPLCRTWRPRKVGSRSSISSQSRLTWLFEIPVLPWLSNIGVGALLHEHPQVHHIVGYHVSLGSMGSRNPTLAKIRDRRR